MSFVLDALKLSEERRSRFARPVYAHPPPVRRRGRRWRWFAVLAAAPIVAGVVLAWRMVAPSSPVPLPAATGGADITAAAEPEAAPATVEGPEESSDLDPPNPGGARSASTVHEQPLVQVPVPVATAGPAPAGQAVDPADGLPLEIAPPDWPVLTLQMLFYSPESGRSFVQINGRNYRVGEHLDDGPEVLEIAPGGVTLAHQGKKVLLAMDR